MMNALKIKNLETRVSSEQYLAGNNHGGQKVYDV